MATPTPIQNTARTPCNKNERGYALVSAMILLVVVTGVVVTLGGRVIVQARGGETFRQLRDCLAGADYAAGLARAELEAGGDGLVGIDGVPTAPTGRPSFGDSRVKPIPVPGMPGIECFADSAPISGRTGGEFVAVRAQARRGMFSRGVEVILQKTDGTGPAWRQVSWREMGASPTAGGSK